MKILSRLLAGLIITLVMNTVQAGIPLWIFTPISDTSITLTRAKTATIEYMVTNQSNSVHTLLMTPIQGINQLLLPGHCFSPFVLGPHESCILTLLVIGNALINDHVTGGPIVCERGIPLQCYQPNINDILDVTIKS